MPAPRLNDRGCVGDHAADDDPSTRWRQLSLWCADWRAAEQIAVTCLGPTVSAAQERGDVTGWWFVRKGPSWRLRLQPAEDIDGDIVVGDVAEALRGSGHVRHVAELVYEPETTAFGGPAAMTTAHELFVADSRHVLDHLACTRGRNDHRRALGVLLAGRLLRAAGLDWYEQGDVWHRIAAHRATTGSPIPTPATVNAVGKLLTAVNDTSSSPLHRVPAWPAAHERAGHALAEIAQSGRLDRGMRAVLTHHLLFTFNRLGISAEQQYVLAASARHFVLQEDHHMTPAYSTEPAPDIASAPTAAQLRDGLADYIRGRGTFRSAAVERAFRTVPRHLFLPDVDLAEAYAPRPVITKRAPNGTALSSASSPNLVADMLELLDARPGHRVLEIGAATGINAALLAEVVGPDGHVVTVEIDHDLTEGARTALDTAGYGHVEVHCADGALGHPSGGPYDRIIVTAGAWTIPAPWWEQLAPGGRLVVPVRLHGSGLTRVLPLDHNVGHHSMGNGPDGDDRMIATSALVCGFVPMRGSDSHPEDVVRLADEAVLAVDMADDPDQDALTGVLSQPARQQWTGITVRHDEPAEHLDLWLATAAGTACFGRLSVSRAIRDAGTVDPALRWAGAALYTGGSIAYLTARVHTEDADELGITAHGPDSDAVAGHLRGLLDQWIHHRPGQPTVIATRSSIDGAQPGYDVVRDHTRLTVTW